MASNTEQQSADPPVAEALRTTARPEADQQRPSAGRPEPARTDGPTKVATSASAPAGVADLRRPLARAGRRLLVVGLAAALCWAILAGVITLLLAGWIDLFWELPAEARSAAVWLAGLAALTVTFVGLIAALRAKRRSAIARRLDAAAGSGGLILTGWELIATRKPRSTQPAVEQGLAAMAVRQAARQATGVRRSRVAPLRPLLRAGGVLAAVAAAVLLLALAMPEIAQTQWRRFRYPLADVPPYSAIKFRIQPGDAEVRYGDPLEIDVEVLGESADELQLLLRDGEGEPSTVLPMFSDHQDHWRAVIARVTEPAEYAIRARRSRSPWHRIDVLTVPEIESVRVRMVPPAYTHRPPTVGAVPEGGIAGLIGTRVEVLVTSNRPLSGGRLLVAADKSTTHPMHPTSDPGMREASRQEEAADNAADRAEKASAPAREVAGQFTISDHGRLEVTITDEDGQACREPFVATITRLTDQRPLIRLLKPRRKSLATPTAPLPVEIDAEDDFGVARLALYRSLNDSRPRDKRFRLPDPPPRRTGDRIYLPLSAYRLSPGDVIKLFARVEDTDPSGPKGTETEVATVRIISQEEFERRVRVRQGIEALMSKYREARRRLERLHREIDQLAREMADMPEDSPLKEEGRRRLQRLSRRSREESEALRKLLEHQLPFAADQRLASELRESVKLTKEMEAELEKLAKLSDLSGPEAARRLRELAAQLQAERTRFGQQVMMPLEMLEKLFPLMVAQERFSALVRYQRDLADRLESLKDFSGGEDNPALKARMRDLEQEQTRIREALEELLDDIERHAAQLPEEEEFAKLRQSAQKFAKAVRGSGALEAMTKAQRGLAEFSGLRGHAFATQAADILEQFLAECEMMGQMAGQCLVFLPSLGQCLGETAAQLLAQMGSGFGNGFGGGFGGSARRGGLYGQLPGQGQTYGDSGLHGPDGPSGKGQDQTTGETHTAEGQSPDRDTYGDIPGLGRATASGLGWIPAAYRHRVGQYFQRLAEEYSKQ